MERMVQRPQRVIVGDEDGPQVWGAMMHRGYKMWRFPRPHGWLLFGVYHPAVAEQQIEEAKAATNNLVKEIHDQSR